MARTEARIQTGIWRNDGWKTLTPLAKLTYLSVLSQPTINLCGVIDLTPKSWASSTGMSKGQMTSALSDLSSATFVHVDEDTEELWIRTFVKNDKVLSKPYVVVSMAKDYTTIRSTEIRGRFLDELRKEQDRFLEWLPVKFPKAFEDGIADHIQAEFIKEYAARFEA